MNLPLLLLSLILIIPGFASALLFLLSALHIRPSSVRRPHHSNPDSTVDHLQTKLRLTETKEHLLAVELGGTKAHRDTLDIENAALKKGFDAYRKATIARMERIDADAEALREEAYEAKTRLCTSEQASVRARKELDLSLSAQAQAERQADANLVRAEKAERENAFLKLALSLAEDRHGAGPKASDGTTTPVDTVDALKRDLEHERERVAAATRRADDNARLADSNARLAVQNGENAAKAERALHSMHALVEMASEREEKIARELSSVEFTLSCERDGRRTAVAEARRLQGVLKRCTCGSSGWRGRPRPQADLTARLREFVRLEEVKRAVDAENVRLGALNQELEMAVSSRIMQSKSLLCAVYDHRAEAEIRQARVDLLEGIISRHADAKQELEDVDSSAKEERASPVHVVLTTPDCKDIAGHDVVSELGVSKLAEEAESAPLLDNLAPPESIVLPLSQLPMSSSPTRAVRRSGLGLNAVQEERSIFEDESDGDAIKGAVFSLASTSPTISLPEDEGTDSSSGCPSPPSTEASSVGSNCSSPTSLAEDDLCEFEPRPRSSLEDPGNASTPTEHI